MMYCVTTSFPDIEAVAVHERRQRKRSRQLHQHTHVVLCGSTPFEVDRREEEIDPQVFPFRGATSGYP